MIRWGHRPLVQALLTFPACMLDVVVFDEQDIKMLGLLLRKSLAWLAVGVTSHIEASIVH